jgi:hypothetical protein
MPEESKTLPCTTSTACEFAGFSPKQVSAKKETEAIVTANTHKQSLMIESPETWLLDYLY